jgi:hypothetical protein
MADGGLLDEVVEIARELGGGDGAAAIGVEDPTSEPHVPLERWP